MTSAIAQLVRGLHDVQDTRHAQLASCCIVVFDHLITLDSEVDLIWRSSWSFGKLLFIINRYYTLACVIFNNYVLFSSSLTDHFCLDFFRWQGWTGLIACMIAEIILQMRLYALYSLNSKILALMIISFTAASTVSALIMGKVLKSIAALAKPVQYLENFVFCSPTNVSTKFYTFWIPILLNECLLCILVLIRGFQTFRSGETIFQTGRHLVSILIRDSVFYFIIITSTYLTCLLVWLNARTTLLEVPIGFSVAMSCVLTNRIILNVREANKEMNRLSTPACQVTIGDDGSRTTLSDAGLTQLRSLRAQRV